MNPLGAGWEDDFEREWNRAFKPDPPLAEIPSQRRASSPFKLENVVRTAIADLRKELGKAWLPNNIYGTRLHAAFRRRMERITVPGGWSIHVEQPLRALGTLPPDILDLTVGQYLDGPGSHLKWLRTRLTGQLHSLIGDIKPDLLVRDRDGVTVIWDLTSREREEHVAKTIFYANLLSHDNRLTRIGETCWLKSCYITPRNPCPIFVVRCRRHPKP